jgi:hypothetical protein
MLDDFEVATRAQMVGILADIKVIRRNRPDHAPCSDRGACKPCADIRFAHLRLDDLLGQLLGEGEDDEAYEAPSPQPQPVCCGICGKRRFRSSLGQIACPSCDTFTGFVGGSWFSLDGEAVE